jgi:hypothetical protein
MLFSNSQKQCILSDIQKTLQRSKLLDTKPAIFWQFFWNFLKIITSVPVLPFKTRCIRLFFVRDGRAGLPASGSGAE